MTPIETAAKRGHPKPIRMITSIGMAREKTWKPQERADGDQQ
jgi:hypothetical protein